MNSQDQWLRVNEHQLLSDIPAVIFLILSIWMLNEWSQYCFFAGSRTNKVEVIKTASVPATSMGIDHPSAAWLTQVGYTASEVEAALIEADLDEQRALEVLFTDLTGNAMFQFLNRIHQIPSAYSVRSRGQMFSGKPVY